MNARSFRLPNRISADGKKLCRVPTCETPVPKGRSSWCCRDHMLLGYYELSTFAGAIYWRDNGICQLCGVDCKALWQWYEHYRRYPGALLDGVQHALVDAGFDLDVRSFWEADHIVPVCEGGPTTMENGRTLCHPCHKRVTREMHQRRRTERIAKLSGAGPAGAGS